MKPNPNYNAFGNCHNNFTISEKAWIGFSILFLLDEGVKVGLGKTKFLFWMIENKGKTPFLAPQREFSKISGFSYVTVFYTVQELMKKGLIKKKPCLKKNNMGDNDCFFVSLEEVSSLSQKDTKKYVWFFEALCAVYAHTGSIGSNPQLKFIEWLYENKNKNELPNSYRGISEQGGISLAIAHKTIKALEEKGLMKIKELALEKFHVIDTVR